MFFHLIIYIGIEIRIQNKNLPTTRDSRPPPPSPVVMNDKSHEKIYKNPKIWMCMPMDGSA